MASKTAVAFLAAVIVAAAAALEETVHVRKDRAGAEILWTTDGVPHIFADNLEVLNYAYGFAHGRDHSAAILRMVGIARGKAAEYWGEEWRDRDVSTWSSRIPQLTELSYQAQNAQSRLEFEAYGAGFSNYIDTHPEEHEGLGPLLKVLPVDGKSMFGVATRALYEFAYSSAIGLSSELEQKWNAAGQPDTFKLRYNANGTHYAAYADWFPDLSAIPKEFRSAVGSNGWAINAPKAAGAAKLEMNPHLLYAGYFRYTEAHFVVASIDLDLYGTGLVGTPNFQIAFNKYLGWTHTVNTIQPYTAYDVALVGDNQYYFDGELLTVTEERNVIRILQEDGSYVEETVVVEHTVHGPVAGRTAGAAVAVRLAGLDRPDALKQWWDMGKARNLTEFKAALGQLQIAMFSVLGATADGDIFHSFNGFVPLRSEGDWSFWRGAMPGDTSRYLWTEVHPFADLPWIENPASGWLQNANDPPWTTTFPLFHPSMDPARYPAYMAPPPYMSYRAQISARLLTGTDNITYDQLVELKHSTLKEYALKAVPELIEAIAVYGNGEPDLQRVAAIWSEWDLTYDTTSRGAYLFDFWRRLAPENVWLIPWSAADPLATPNTLADPAACVDAIREAVRQMRLIGHPLDIEYGAVHLLPDGERADAGLVLPGNGAIDTFRATWWLGSDLNVLGAVGGDSWVCVVEFTAEYVVAARRMGAPAAASNVARVRRPGSGGPAVLLQGSASHLADRLRQRDARRPLGGAAR